MVSLQWGERNLYSAFRTTSKVFLSGDYCILLASLGCLGLLLEL
jgi:hypothetical protein